MAIKIAGNVVVDNNSVFFPVNSAEVSTNLSISFNTLTVNLNAGSVFNVTLNSNITTFNITNIQASGLASSFVLVLTSDGNARTVVWPTSFKWPAFALSSALFPTGVTPNLTSTAGRKDVFSFFTTDGGTSWSAFNSGQNL